MIPDKKQLLSKILNRFELDSHSLHGPSHWGRVLTNGLKIADHVSDVDIEVVELFAFFHDSCRLDDGSDPFHGKRAAIFAESLRDECYSINDDQFKLFSEACEYHTSGRDQKNMTIASCWDADRLDLARVGITPDPAYLITEYAKRADVIDWAVRRSIKNITLGKTDVKRCIDFEKQGCK